jgi:hypothetical protein
MIRWPHVIKGAQGSDVQAGLGCILWCASVCVVYCFLRWPNAHLTRLEQGPNKDW